jgi:hypothetical protein
VRRSVTLWRSPGAKSKPWSISVGELHTAKRPAALELGFEFGTNVSLLDVVQSATRVLSQDQRQQPINRDARLCARGMIRRLAMSGCRSQSAPGRKEGEVATSECVRIGHVTLARFALKLN